MNEAPKKIWLTNAMQSMIPRADPNDPPFPAGMKPIRSTIYIRADIVEEMREALEGLVEYVGRDHAGVGLAKLHGKGIYALKRLEEE